MITLEDGQVWLPENAWSAASPRKIKPFRDINGDPWVIWNYPGYPGRCRSVTARSFRDWIRRNGATLEKR